MRGNDRTWRETTGSKTQWTEMGGVWMDKTGNQRKGNYRTRKEKKVKPPRLDHEMCDSFYTLGGHSTLHYLINNRYSKLWNVTCGCGFAASMKVASKFHAVFAIAVALSGRATHSTHWTSEFAFLIPFTSFSEKVKYRNHSVLVLNSFDETWFYIILKGKHIHMI